MVIVIAWVMILVSMHRLTRHPVIYLCTDRQIKSIEGCFAPKITYKHKISSFNILSYIKYLKYHCSGGAIVKMLMSTNIKILDNIIVNSNIFFCQLLIELKSRVWEGLERKHLIDGMNTLWIRSWHSTFRIRNIYANTREGKKYFMNIEMLRILRISIIKWYCLTIYQNKKKHFAGLSVCMHVLMSLCLSVRWYNI